MRQRLALFIGAMRVRIEGRDRAEQAAPFWDRIVRWLVAE